MRKLLLLLVSVLPVEAANIRYEVTGLLGGKLDFIASDFITNLPPTEIKPEIFTIWELPDSALLSSPCRSFRGDRACTSLSFYLDFTGGGESAVVEWKWFDQIDHIEKVGDNVRIFDIDFSQLGQ